MKKIILIFTRDFNFWCNQIIRDLYVREFPHLWGRGLKDQITYFTGRSFEWWRYSGDLEKLQEYVVHKKLGDSIFSLHAQQNFRKDAKELQRLIEINPQKIKTPAGYYEKIKDIFVKMYPYYALAVFLPGAWRERFLEVHGKSGEKIIDRIYISRELSEGLVKLTGDFMRSWFGPQFKKLGYNPDYVKLLSVSETDAFVKKGALPAKSVLQSRAKGFVHIGGRVVLASNFDRFLKANELRREVSINGIRTIQGSVAYPGKLITGKVQTIFNSNEVGKFKRGSILVTPMTSPEYIPAMRKAKAVITDEGGITCHAAITARELKVSTIIGTRVATKFFKDGTTIKADATSGKIYKL